MSTLSFARSGAEGSDVLEKARKQFNDIQSFEPARDKPRWQRHCSTKEEPAS
jgi:hypothetical protein